MFIVDSYSLAVILCIITMICWGSWGNSQKLAAKSLRYELFYWDYVLGILLLSMLAGFTLGSIGNSGRSFMADLIQLAPSALLSCLTGGIIFNGANILLSASISIAGMSVAFPIGVGLALVLGVFINYFGSPQGNPTLIFSGVFLIILALLFNGLAYKKKEMSSKGDGKNIHKGIWLAIAAGILMSFFYRFVAASMDLNNFESPEQGKATPYTAFFIFSLGIFVSNFVFNTILMKKPIEGAAISYSEYFRISLPTHCVGLLGGIIWGIGTLFSYIAAGKAGAAISYALGQGAPMIAALWGVFVWKEFKGRNTTVSVLLTLMFLLFIAGLCLIVMAG